MATLTSTATINQSAFVSNVVRLENTTMFGAWVPTVTSGQMFMQATFDADTTSANFVRVQNSAGSGDWTFAVGPGSKSVSLQDAAFPFASVRFESSVAQANSVALVVQTKVR